MSIQEQEQAAQRQFFEQYLAGLISYAEFMLQLSNYEVTQEGRRAEKELP